MAANNDTNNRMNADQIRELLCSNIDGLVRELLPNAIQDGDEWLVGSVNGEAGESLKIARKGAKSGMWLDFAETGGFAEKGKGPIDLIQEVFGVDDTQAITWGRQFVEGTDRNATPARADEARRKRVADARADNGRNLDTARRLWGECGAVAGSPAETYLRRRKLIYADGETALPANAGYHAGLWHKGAQQHAPALVVRREHPDGTFAGVQRTFLAPDGSGKAGFENDKLSLGRAPGAVVWLKGDGDTLFVAEGVESALALHAAEGGAAVATLGKSNFGHLNIPGKFAKVVIAPDNDDGGDPHAAANEAARRLIKQGHCVAKKVPPEGCDFADLIAGKAPP